MVDRRMLAKIVCARDSKHQMVGQNLDLRRGTSLSRNSLSFPWEQARVGGWKQKKYLFSLSWNKKKKKIKDVTYFFPSVCLYMSVCLDNLHDRSKTEDCGYFFLMPKVSK